ncbi:MAG: site-specific DNA-methyltransferase, partial [Pseudomonadota bacterium]|nr:site-specific DNA-methyltransferase [Pseudomonadota bacterium]
KPKTDKRDRSKSGPGFRKEAVAYKADFSDLLTLEEAAQKTGKTIHNIRDYIQRERIAKLNMEGKPVKRAENGELRVSLKELQAFLYLVSQRDEKHHRAGLHPELGFYNVPERERTRHVNRLHPYLGKFIPQLVEWFLSRYFKRGDWILDPFMGSGTTLVQASEMGMASIGVDVSEFNCHIAKVKLAHYDLAQVRKEILEAESRVQRFSDRLQHKDGQSLELFPEERLDSLKTSLLAECKSDYLRTWFAPNALLEMLYYRRLIPHYKNQDLLRIILSRAVRSSRLITHYDLATPKMPVALGVPYWCRKHNRMCLPIDNCIEKIHAYSNDTVRRITEFSKLRNSEPAIVVNGDSRNVRLNEYMPDGVLLDGIFTSPPYVGQIDYHDQHVYAYELFGFPRNDVKEIGPKKSGKSKAAQEAYINDIAAVFRNACIYLKPDAKVFIVANDRFNLYPRIAELSGLKIKETILRAVTKRTEQGNDPYQESIFYCVKMNNVNAYFKQKKS